MHFFDGIKTQTHRLHRLTRVRRHSSRAAELALLNQVDDVTTDQLMTTPAPYSKSLSLRFSFTAFFSSSHVIFFSQPFDTILPK